MTMKPTNLLGGDSVYCINEAQLKEATRLMEEDAYAAPILQDLIARIERRCSRNEQAALAFMIIERLRQAKN
jgi:hypothetical protein